MNIKDNPAELNVLQVGYVFKSVSAHFLILGWETNEKIQVSRIRVVNLNSGHVSWCPPHHPRKAWMLVAKKFKPKKDLPSFYSKR